MSLTAARLRELLHYDPLTGVFTRRVRTSQNNRAGDVAGGVNKGGYVQISVDGKLYYGHRLAALYMTGEWVAEVDHRYGVRNDNRWGELRIGDRSFNRQNLRSAMKTSITGLLGVSPSFSKFEARICVNRKTHRLGRFDTPEAAHAAYIAAKRELHSACTI